MTTSAKTCPKCGATFGAEVIFCPNDRTRLDQSAGELTGRIIADRYRIISRIGEGGMGEVYLAEHVHMKRRCAVKMLNPDLAGDPGAMKRFMREAANASRIDHPNVVTVYDFGEMPDRSAYLAMEYIEGESLRKRIERKVAMPRDVIASVLRQTASALHAAHALGIVHRDLKPDNIMLLERDGELRVKVVDFGIAKAKSDKTKVTATGAIVGTPDYMSPEQLMADEVTGGADQYSLALVAVKMLTGKLPFATTTSIESMTSRLTTAPMALRELRQDIAWPQQLQDCIARALSTEPSQRYATVVEFSRAFDKAVGGMSGALAATVPDVRISGVARKVAESAAAAAPAPAPTVTIEERSRAPLVAALIAIMVVGGGGAVWWSTRQTGAVGEATTPAVADSPRAVVDAAPQQQQPSAMLQSRTPPASPDPPAQTTTTPSEVKPDTVSSAALNPVAPSPASSVVQRPDSIPAPTVAASSPVTESRVIPEISTRPPARDTTPPAVPAPPPDAPPAVSAAEFTAEYSAIRTMVAADAPAPQLSTAVTRINALLPRTGARPDSIRLLYLRAQAQSALEDPAAACASLKTALGIAAGLPLEPVLRQTAQRLSCRD